MILDPQKRSEAAENEETPSDAVSGGFWGSSAIPNITDAVVTVEDKQIHVNKVSSFTGGSC